MVIIVTYRIILKSIKTVLWSAALFLVLLIASCGIFSPRGSEPPNLSGKSDPLSFSSILSGTTASFTKLQYEDLFTDDLYYLDNNTETSYSKNDLIGKLNQILLSYKSIKVVWKPGGTPPRELVGPPPLDTFVLSGLSYFIYKTGNLAGAPDDSGNSNFVVTEDNQSIWHISSWHDVPARTTGQSFFVQ